MIEKIELRKKLKSISMVSSNYSFNTLNKLNQHIENKIVCTYIPLKTEIDINMHLTTQSLLTTTCLTDNEIKICNYKDPLELNSFGVYQPLNLEFVDKVDVFLVPGLGFDMSGNRLGKGSGIYDQILSKYTGSFFIGVTDSQHIVDQIPFESHDISMNALITHDEFIEIKI